MTILHLAGETHDGVPELLPWYLSGRLGAGEAAHVERHLGQCAQCREELEFERRLRGALQPQEVAAAGADAAAERGLETLLPRLRTPPPRAAARAPARRHVAWLPWALGLQFALMLVLTGLLLGPRLQPEPYRALGEAAAGDRANAIAMFRPEASEAAIRESLRDAGARLVGGPTAANAYLLNVPAADPDAALARLRAHAAVTLAQPLQPEPAR